MDEARSVPLRPQIERLESNMRGGLRKERTDAVEIATEQHREACELRLARIQNGAEPSHQNGAHTVTLVSAGTGGCRWTSTSGRQSPIFRGQATATDWRRSHPKWD
jgi:hypothetical protein